ncbi:MAG: head GIN domain-containing protein [Bernardetiaceae bacterium]
MRRFQIFLGLFFCLPSLFAQQETRSLPQFNQIECLGSFDVQLQAGNKPSVLIQTEGIKTEDIITEVGNGTLKIYPRKKNFWQSQKKDAVRITVTYHNKDLTKIILGGSGNITNADALTGKDIQLSVRGSGNLKTGLKADRVSLTIQGSGDLTTYGKADQATLRVQGSGSVIAYELKTRQLEAKINGSGDVSVYVRDQLDVQINGSGDVRYKGDPSQKQIRIQGSGKVRKTD